MNLVQFLTEDSAELKRICDYWKDEFKKTLTGDKVKDQKIVDELSDKVADDLEALEYSPAELESATKYVVKKVLAQK